MILRWFAAAWSRQQHGVFGIDSSGLDFAPVGYSETVDLGITGIACKIWIFPVMTRNRKSPL